MEDAKSQTSMRISRDGTKILKLLSEKLGIARTAVMEIALRDLAKKEAIVLPEKEAKRE